MKPLLNEFKGTKESRERVCVIDRVTGKARLLLLTFTFVSFLTISALAGNLKNVVVISIDALHPDTRLGARIPTFQTLMDSGAYTLDGKSTSPPKTLISHAALFTGMQPAENGKTDTSWQPGQPTISKNTIFNSVRSHGFRTGYFYANRKLGYIANDAIDAHQWSQENSIDLGYIAVMAKQL